MLCLKAGQLGEVEIRLLTVYADIFSRMLRNYSSVQDKRRKLQVFLKYPRLLQKSAIFQRFSEANHRPHLARMTNFGPPPFNSIMLISVYGEIQITVCLKKTVSLSYTVGSTAAVME